MKTNKTQKKRRLLAVVLVLFMLCAGLVGLGLSTDFWSPLAKYWPSFAIRHSDADEHDADEHDADEHEHDEHDADEHDADEHDAAEHEHDEHDAAMHLMLDDASLFNIGIEKDGELTLQLQEYQKSFRVPGIVREIPGRSINSLTATVSGIVTKVEARQGDVLCPGSVLLEIQLAHEEAIQCQTELIALLQQRDVIQMEEERLGLLDEGIAPKSQRELQLKKFSNDAAIQSQRNLLKVHGFTDAMIEKTIVGQRLAITQFMVRVPEINGDGIAAQTEEQHAGNDKEEHDLILERLLVNKGDSVRMGDILCQISDLRTLQIEGKAFASNENMLNDAFLKQSPVAAIFADPVKSGASQTIDGLTIARIDNFIAQESQTVSCWINLSNCKLTRSGENQPGESESALSGEKTNPPTLFSGTQHSSCGEKTISWRFKPGQRCELAIGYETIRDCFVLPPEAVALDRSHAFVFELTEIHEGKRVWTQKPVRILFRSGNAIVVAHDETIQPGMKIAKSGAEQLLVALGSGSGKLQSACEHDH